MNGEERVILKIIMVSDLHITKYKNFLDLIVDPINNEIADIVVVTGDVIHEKDKELYKIAQEGLNKIKHRVIMIPGEYDYSPMWEEYFGQTYKSININDYCLDFLDTSFMGNRHAIGWGECLKVMQPDQYDHLKKSLAENDRYHIIFSHHPFWVVPKEEGDEYLNDNVRALYSGHLHEVKRYYFKYDEPRAHFEQGYMSVPLKFHGNACFLLMHIKANDEIINYPRLVRVKRTAW